MSSPPVVLVADDDPLPQRLLPRVLAAFGTLPEPFAPDELPSGAELVRRGEAS